PTKLCAPGVSMTANAVSFQSKCATAELIEIFRCISSGSKSETVFPAGTDPIVGITPAPYSIASSSDVLPAPVYEARAILRVDSARGSFIQPPRECGMDEAWWPKPCAILEPVSKGCQRPFCGVDGRLTVPGARRKSSRSFHSRSGSLSNTIAVVPTTGAHAPVVISYSNSTGPHPAYPANARNVSPGFGFVMSRVAVGISP